MAQDNGMMRREKRKTDLSCDNSYFYDLEQTKIEKKTA